MSSPFGRGGDGGREWAEFKEKEEDEQEALPPPASASPPADTRATNASGNADDTYVPKKGKKAKSKKAKSAAAPEAIELASPSGVGSPSTSEDTPESQRHDLADISVMPSPPHAAGAAASAATSSRPAAASSSSPSRASPGESLAPIAIPASHTSVPIADPITFDRTVLFNDALSRAAPSEVPSEYPSNLVRTSKYTAFDFLPRNLFEQFSQPSNTYFLFIGILQAIPAISTTSGIPTNYLPLLFIITVSAIRSALEDYARHQTDALEGAKKYLVYDGHVGDFVTKSSADIVVGDVVKMVFGDQTGSGGNGSSRRDSNADSDPPISYSASFPADLLMLSSSHERGHTFVETASLDGETNLKIKNSLPAVQNALWTPPSAQNPTGSQVSRLAQLDISIDVESPNARFDSFKGVLHLNASGRMSGVPAQKLPLKAENLLLRGTELRNTTFVYGLVVYTGVDTKIRRNVRTARSAIKISGVMQRVNELLVHMLALQFALCILGAILCFTWTHTHHSSAWYLQFDEGAGVAAVRSFFTWFIILSQMVPISLLVSNELVKGAQAKFIAWDLSMYDPVTDQPTIVRNTQLHESLGQVEYVFSDKTGTLTQNKMEFRVGFVGATPFGSPDSEIARRVAMRMEQLREQSSSSPASSAAFRTPPPTWTERVRKLVADQQSGKTASQMAFSEEEKVRMLAALWGQKRGGAGNGPQPPEDEKLSQEIRTFLTHMAISNTITPELKKKPKGSKSSGPPALGVVSPPDSNDEYVLNFSSPDELALCKFAFHMGFQFQSRSKDGIQLAIDKLGHADNVREVEIYQSLGTLDFNSKRKRVTCIYLRDQTVHVMCKGADANVLPLLTHKQDAESVRVRDTLDRQLTDMCTKGLRTLVLASATLPYSWWFGDDSHGGMSAVYKATNLPDRGAEKGHARGECQADCRICAGLLEIEKQAHLSLLGATAIEDRLQDLVPECIEDFLRAGIKVWMLTGDKRETAKNIGLATNLIDPGMEAVDLLGSLSVDDMNRVIEITGDWVTMTNDRDALRQMFDILDCGGDIVDGQRTNFISREELRYFLIGLRVTGMDDDRVFDSHWAMVDNRGDGRISFPEFSRFMRNLKPSHLKAVQTDIELGLRKARLIAGDGTEEEKRERLEQTPISLVVEGEAFSVFFPDTKPRRQPHVAAPASSPLGRMFGTTPSSAPSDMEEEEDESEPEVLLLRDTFFELASMAKSVICCRLTPAQKARIVEEFVRGGHVTVAIGDGGNDESMIKKASIGVGITGLEGTAASRAADYAIGSFRFLHTLLFVHGFWSYRRICKLVTFIFYKAALVALAMYVFGFYSAMSGQQLYNDAIYILYSICFTALPILFVAITDQGGLHRDTLENDTKSYLSIAHGMYFNDRKALSWIVRAIWNAMFIFYLVYRTIGVEDVSGSDGLNNGLWLTSTVIYTIIVLLVTARIFLECQTINAIVALVAIASGAIYFPIVLFCASLRTLNPNLYGTFPHIFNDPIIWLTIIFGVSLPLMVDAAIWALRRDYSPSYVDVLQERQRLSLATRIRMDQEAFVSNQHANTARVRTRTVPQLSQQQKDDKLLQKIRKALQQAQQETERAVAAGTSSASQQDSQRRAEALVYTMTRLQNLSGSNFDATPQRGLMSLYEVSTPLTAAEMQQMKDREHAIAVEAQKQHAEEMVRQEQAAKEEEERRRHAPSTQRIASPSHSLTDAHRVPLRQGSQAHRASDGSAHEHEVVFQLDGAEDDDDDDIVEHDSATGHGAGRLHLHGTLMDEEDEVEDVDF